MDDFCEKLLNALQPKEPLSEDALARLEEHYHLLVEWNAQINLVSRKSLDRAIVTHYCDSIHLSQRVLPYIQDLSVVELGSGAGFPGIIFSILNPQVPVGLYEKNGKKRTFLEEVIDSLGLDHVSLGGVFPEGRQKAFVLNRAVMPREKLLDFFGRVLLGGSRFNTALGGMGSVTPPPKQFKTLGIHRYELSQEEGFRRMEILEVVSRGTKKR